MNEPWDKQTEADVELVQREYNRCWQRSKGKYNKWIEGRLHPVARRLYIVVNATGRCCQDGIVAVLEDIRFTLQETAEAFRSFGLDSFANAIDECRRLIDDRQLSRDPRERDRQLGEIDFSQANLDRIHGLFYSHPEEEVYRRLAQVIREHPEAFPADDSGPAPLMPDA